MNRRQLRNLKKDMFKMLSFDMKLLYLYFIIKLKIRNLYTQLLAYL